MISQSASSVKKVLTIDYHGTLRTGKFCKYLPLFGFSPTILAESRGFRSVASKRGYVNPESIKTVCTPAILHFEFVYYFLKFGISPRLFLLPDPLVGWVPTAYIKGLNICHTDDIDLIYVSSPPMSATIVGYLLKRRTHIPLVIDFRDPWTLLQDPVMSYPSRFHQSIDQQLERHILREADQIITATPPMAQGYSIAYPEVKDKITTICNGFDSADFKQPPAKFEKFTITYTGSLVGSGHRPYRLFLEALRDVIDRGAIKEEEIQVLFIGPKGQRLVKDFTHYGLQTICTVTGQVPYEQALSCAASSSILLLIELTNALTQKVYEYLATGRPILAIVREGTLARLVRKYSPHSCVITSNSVDEISDNIIAAYHKWQRGDDPVNPDGLKEYSVRFERKNLTRELAKVFAGVIRKSTNDIREVGS